MYITAERLRQHGACETSVRRFTNYFPNGINVTRFGCKKYYAHFNWGWALLFLLPKPIALEYRQYMRERLETVATHYNDDAEMIAMYRASNDFRLFKADLFALAAEKVK